MKFRIYGADICYKSFPFHLWSIFVLLILLCAHVLHLWWKETTKCLFHPVQWIRRMNIDFLPSFTVQYVCFLLLFRGSLCHIYRRCNVEPVNKSACSLFYSGEQRQCVCSHLGKQTTVFVRPVQDPTVCTWIVENPWWFVGIGQKRNRRLNDERHFFNPPGSHTSRKSGSWNPPRVPRGHPE